VRILLLCVLNAVCSLWLFLNAVCLFYDCVLNVGCLFYDCVLNGVCIFYGPYFMTVLTLCVYLITVWLNAVGVFGCCVHTL
jgi:hypothetical protein